MNTLNTKCPIGERGHDAHDFQLSVGSWRGWVKCGGYPFPGKTAERDPVPPRDEVEGPYVGHQNHPREITIRVRFQLTEDPSEDAKFLAVVEKELKLQFGSMLLGVEQEALSSKWKTCGACSGTGLQAKLGIEPASGISFYLTCVQCNGTGSVPT